MPDLKLILEILKVIFFGRKTSDENEVHIPFETKVLVSNDEEEDG